MKKITLITIILGVFIIANAQTILSADSVQFVPRNNELRMTPEITEMLVNITYSLFINDSDKWLSKYGIKDRSQLNSLQLGKPIPRYLLDNGNLRFLNRWTMLVMSDGEPLHFVTVRLMEDGQYKWAGTGSGSAGYIEKLQNYEHKDLIIGYIDTYTDANYLCIRKDNKDVFVKEYDYKTDKYFSGEYSLSDIINLIEEE